MAKILKSNSFFKFSRLFILKKILFLITLKAENDDTRAKTDSAGAFKEIKDL